MAGDDYDEDNEPKAKGLSDDDVQLLKNYVREEGEAAADQPSVGVGTIPVMENARRVHEGSDLEWVEMVWNGC